MTASGTAVSVERLVDAVLMGETADAVASGKSPMVMAIGERYAPFFSDMGAVVAREATAALAGRTEMTLGEVVSSISESVCSTVSNELIVTAAVVLLLAQTLAERSDVDTGYVLREVLEAFQKGASDG